MHKQTNIESIDITSRTRGGKLVAPSTSKYVLNFVLFILYMVLGAGWNVQAQPAQALFSLYDGGNTPADMFSDIYLTNDNDYLLCGQKNYNPWLVKVNPRGDRLWSAESEGVRLFSVIEADNGDALATGTIGDVMLGVERYDRNGNQVWSQEYVHGRGSAIIELKEGDFVVCGDSSGRGYITRLDGDGRIIWGFSYNCTRLEAMRETDGGIVAVGRTVIGQTYQGHALKINFDGEVLWEHNYPLNEGRNSIYFKAIVSIDGGFAIGASYAIQHPDFAIFIINSFGEATERHLLSLGDARYSFESLNKLSAGGYVLVGYINGGQQRCYPLMVRTDNDVNVIWTKNWADSVNQRQFRPNELNQLISVVVSREDEIVACGAMVNLDNRRQGDAWLVKFDPDRAGPVVLTISPEDTIQQVLLSDSLSFSIYARNRDHEEILYRWFFDETEIGSDSTELIIFEQLGTFSVNCIISCQGIENEIRWHVTVTDLYISAFTPDTLDLTLRRGSSVDFSIDTVRYIDGAEPEYLWTVTNLDNPGEPEFGGSETAATITFNQSGSYSVEGLAYRGESSDAVTWNITVRGAIWAFAPEELAFEVLPDSLIQFDVLPTVPDAEGQTICWLVDGEVVAEDTTAFTWRADFNPPYLAIVQVVVADTVEADTVSWEVTVREPDAVDDNWDAYPARMELLSVSPNPFNSTLTIRFDVGARHAVPLQIAIYDISGRMVAVIPAVTSPQVTDEMNAATRRGAAAENSVVWDASSIPAGVYFVRLQSGREIITKKVVLMK